MFAVRRHVEERVPKCAGTLPAPRCAVNRVITRESGFARIGVESVIPRQVLSEFLPASMPPSGMLRMRAALPPKMSCSSSWLMFMKRQIRNWSWR